VFWHFCGVCGTPLFSREAVNPKFMGVSIASLDTPQAVPPTRHIWTDSKVAWFDTADQLPRYPAGERPKG
jgi:hypothetical protein